MICILLSFFIFYFLVRRKKYFSMGSKKLEPSWSESFENDKKYIIIWKHHVEKIATQFFFLNFDDKKYFSPKIKVSENSKLDFWNLLKPPKNILKGQIKIMIFFKSKMSPKCRANLRNQKNISAIQKFWQNLKKKWNQLVLKRSNPGYFNKI